MELCRNELESRSIDPRHKKPRGLSDILKRMFNCHDIIAMTVKHLISTAEKKDLHVQFGATASTYTKCVRLGMILVVKVLANDPRAKVWWDKSGSSLKLAAERTATFLDITGVVGMLDGLKVTSLNPSNPKEQNRDYNGWTGDTNRNLLLLWDPFGKIVDVVVNLLGSYHDSRAASWGNVYTHISSLPDGYRVVCDSAFLMKGEVENKLMKSKQMYNGLTVDPCEHDQ